MAGNKNSGRRNLTTAQKRDVAERIVKLVKAGSFVDKAIATAGGISYREAMKWLANGRRIIASERKPDGDAQEFEAWFAAEIDSSVAAAETRCVLTITRAMEDDWKAAAWLLERKYPKRWGQKIAMSVREEIDEFLQRLENRLPEEVYEAVLRAGLAGIDDPSAEPDSNEPTDTQH